MQDPEMTPVTDPRTLRAFAHPVRTRLLEEIAARGPQRAADLATHLDLPANQISFHLRQLAKYGLVQEAPELARDRRDRVWRTSDGRHGWTLDLERVAEQPGGRAAANAWRGMASERAHRFVDVAYTAPRDPASMRSITQVTYLLSKAEAEELSAELGEVLARWSELSRNRPASTVDDVRPDDQPDPQPDPQLDPQPDDEAAQRQVYALLQILQPRVDDAP